MESNEMCMTNSNIADSNQNTTLPTNIKNTSKLPTIGDITIKKRYWGCLICKSIKNSNKQSICLYCGTKRAQDRFVICRNQAIYQCKVHTEKVFPIVSIFKTQFGHEVSGKVRLKLIYDTLRECMECAIDDFESENFLTLRTTRETDSGMDMSLQDTPSKSSLTEDLTLDLFHRVMKNGENYAYDGNIGQYVHIDTLKNRDNETNSNDNSNNTTNSNSSNIVKDLHYLKFMKREKVEMTKIVEETLHRRNAEYIENVIDLTYDTLSEWKEKCPCALCEFLFPPAQLLGIISLKTLITWREEHNVQTTLSEAKLSLNNIYSNVRLCLFCSQFFDTNFSHSLDIETNANKVIKKQLKEKIRQQKTKEKETPVTRIQMKLSIAELYNKKIGSIKQKILEPLSTLELKRLEEEKRKLEYLHAKKKFKAYKKVMQQDLIECESYTDAPSTSRSQQSQQSNSTPTRKTFSSPCASLLTLSPMSSRDNINSSTILRSVSSEGQVKDRLQLPTISKSNNNNNNNNKQQKLQSSSSLPQLKPSKKETLMKSDSEKQLLEPVKEGDLETTGEILHSHQQQQQQQQLKDKEKRKMRKRTNEKVAATATTTGLDDLLGFDGVDILHYPPDAEQNTIKEEEEEYEDDDQKLQQQEEEEQKKQSEQQQQSQQQQNNKKISTKTSKESKPEWIDVRPNDLQSNQPSNKSAAITAGGEDNNQNNNNNNNRKKGSKVAQLLNEVTKNYSQVIETDVPKTHPKKTKKSKQVDTSYTKRRRNRLDPRNNIKKSSTNSSSLSSSSTTKKSKKKLSREEKEALRKIQATVVCDDNSEKKEVKLHLSPRKAMEILEKHQAPNLMAAKKMTFNRPTVPKLVEIESHHDPPKPTDEVVSDEEDDDDAEYNDEEEEEQEIEDEDEVEKKKEDTRQEFTYTTDKEYDDETFEEFGATTKSHNSSQTFKVTLNTTTESVDSGQGDEYKDDCDQFEEEEEVESDHNAIEKELNRNNPSNSSTMTMAPINSFDQNQPIPHRSRGGSRSIELNSPVCRIELLSGSGQRIGTAPKSKRSNRKLPQFENVEPLLITTENEINENRVYLSSPSKRPGSVQRLTEQDNVVPQQTTSTTTKPLERSHPKIQLMKQHSTPSSSSAASQTSKQYNNNHKRMSVPSNYIIQPSQPHLNHQPSYGHESHTKTEDEATDSFEQNVDSKFSQKVMQSIDRNSNQMRRPTAILNETNMTGTPSALDMNIMKQSGQIRRQIKREDSFDKLTRRISRSLQQSSLK